MRRTPLVLAPLALGVAMTGPALSADPIVFEPAPPISVPAPVHDWSGFYAGGLVGFSAGEAPFVDADGEQVPLFDELSGVSAGVTAGYSIQNGGFVYGLEGDILLGGPSQTFDEFGEVTYRLDYHGTLRGRVGYAFDTVLPYVTGGLAFGGGSFHLDGGQSEVTFSANHLGWTAGGGAEVMATDQISLKGEYLYTDLGTADYMPEEPGGGFDVTFHSIRAGVNFHF